MGLKKLYLAFVAPSGLRLFIYAEGLIQNLIVFGCLILEMKTFSYSRNHFLNFSRRLIYIATLSPYFKNWIPEITITLSFNQFMEKDHLNYKLVGFFYTPDKN